MNENRLLAYCGMYCGDCLGKTGVIADAATGFLKTLDRYQFERTALNVFPEDLNEYDTMIDTVEFMAGLRCRTTCREVDGGESRCEVRGCAVENGYYACNECSEFEDCEKLDKMLGVLHSESCRNNLRAINRMGLELWLYEGIRHHYWDRK